jgi:hypothetical protein
VVFAPTSGTLGLTHPMTVQRKDGPLARHSKFERERRSAETERVKQIEAAWMGSLPTAAAKAFAESVAVARARRPEAKRPDMAPGTAPRPPRPGHEPKPPKDERPRRSNRD